MQCTRHARGDVPLPAYFDASYGREEGAREALQGWTVVFVNSVSSVSANPERSSSLHAATMGAVQCVLLRSSGVRFAGAGFRQCIPFLILRYARCV